MGVKVTKSRLSTAFSRSPLASATFIARMPPALAGGERLNAAKRRLGQPNPDCLIGSPGTGGPTGKDRAGARTIKDIGGDRVRKLQPINTVNGFSALRGFHGSAGWAVLGKSGIRPESRFGSSVLGDGHQPGPAVFQKTGRSRLVAPSPYAVEEANIMKLRMGALLWLSVICTLASVQSTRASGPFCGAGSYGSNPCCDAQSCYPSCQQQNRICYKLVWDTVTEKRWHTCYKPVQETITKQVCKTVWKEECKTLQRQVQKVVCQDVSVECVRPVQKTVMKEETVCVMKPVQSTEIKECHTKICKQVQQVMMKECVETKCVPVTEQHVSHCYHQIQKQVSEQHVKECLMQICKPVCETHHKTVCCQVCKVIDDPCVKNCCCTVWENQTETCFKECVTKCSKPVVTCKSVTKKCGEWVCETYCKPGRCITCWVDCCDCCFDPCTCQTVQTPRKVRVTKQCPPEMCTRKVWKVKCVTEQVPCTTYVQECVRTKVPYTVCRKVAKTITKQVPYTVRRSVRGAYVDDKGNAFECDGPGRHFQENAVARKDIPYQTQRMVTECIKKQIPYTVTKCLVGAYVDGKSPDGYAENGPGRYFQADARIKTEHVTQTCKMVQSTVTKKIPYTVCQNVIEDQVQKVPYTVCKMVPTNVTRQVQHTVCEMQKYTEVRKVPKMVTEMETYTVRCKVPTQVVETIPCTVTRMEKVCVPETVCVKRLRKVAVAVDPPCAPACPSCTPSCTPACTPSCTPACTTCAPVCTPACTPSCCPAPVCKTTCDPCQNCCTAPKHRWFSSSSCCDTCNTTCTPACTTTCNTCKTNCCDPCQTSCNSCEGLLQRLFRSRFACDACCDPCSSAPLAPIPAKN